MANYRLISEAKAELTAGVSSLKEAALNLAGILGRRSSRYCWRKAAYRSTAAGCGSDLLPADDSKKSPREISECALACGT